MTLIINNRNQNIADSSRTWWFIDIDGTIAEWKQGSEDDLAKPGYFRHLAPTPFLKPLREFAAAGGNVCILSHYMAGCPALDDKQEWLNEHFPEVPESRRLFVLCGFSKPDYVKASFGLDELDGRMILLDDHSPNLLAWKAAGGRGIKCYNGINGLKGTWRGEGVRQDRELAAVLSAYRRALDGRRMALAGGMLPTAAAALA